MKGDVIVVTLYSLPNREFSYFTVQVNGVDYGSQPSDWRIPNVPLYFASTSKICSFSVQYSRMG